MAQATLDFEKEKLLETWGKFYLFFFKTKVILIKNILLVNDQHKEGTEKGDSTKMEQDVELEAKGVTATESRIWDTTMFNVMYQINMKKKIL